MEQNNAASSRFSKKTWWIAGAIGAVIVVGIILLVSGVFAPEGESSNNIGDETSTTTPVEDGGEDTVGTNLLSLYSGDILENIGNDPFIQKLPADIRNKYIEQIFTVVSTIKKNPSDIEQWIALGILKKSLNNYTGARDAWEFAKVVNSKNSIPYFNLAGLYSMELKQYAKAEENYKAALQRDKYLPYIYLGFAEFYAVFNPTKSIDKAVEVIKSGLLNIPDDPSLLHALQYYEALQKGA